jgi:ATP-dependent DNA helicase RecQ
VCLNRGIEALVAPGVAIERRVGHGRAPGGAPSADFDPALFERLRALRKRLADAEGVPAYIVFSDAVLRQMAEHRPRTREGMLALSGVGPVKLERYGAEFLAALGNG